jgi:hypothetical protein
VAAAQRTVDQVVQVGMCIHPDGIGRRRDHRIDEQQALEEAGMPRRCADQGRATERVADPEPDRPAALGGQPLADGEQVLGEMVPLVRGRVFRLRGVAVTARIDGHDAPTRAQRVGDQRPHACRSRWRQQRHRTAALTPVQGGDLDAALRERERAVPAPASARAAPAVGPPLAWIGGRDKVAGLLPSASRWPLAVHRYRWRWPGRPMLVIVH